MHHRLPSVSSEFHLTDRVLWFWKSKQSTLFLEKEAEYSVFGVPALLLLSAILTAKKEFYV